MIPLVVEIPEPPFFIGDEVKVVSDWDRNGVYGIVKDITFNEISYSLVDGVKIKPFWGSVLVEVKGHTKDGITVISPIPYYVTLYPSQLALRID